MKISVILTVIILAVGIDPLLAVSAALVVFSLQSSEVEVDSILLRNLHKTSSISGQVLNMAE